MNIRSLETTNFMLDGGAMFGVVPKSLWSKQYPSDENNLCNLSNRLLLIEDDNKKILIDTGLGEKHSEIFFKYYNLNNKISLSEALQNINISTEEITDVILTHLHFDHCGGATIIGKNSNEIIPLFNNARYWVSKTQWEWALNPNPREKSSYFKENFLPLLEKKQLNFIENTIFQLTKNIYIRIFNGHTRGLLVPFIKFENKTIVYTTDFIPTSAHIPINWVCGYDIEPLVTMKERQEFLEEALKNNYILFFEHDLYTECCTLMNTEKGIRLKERFKLNEVIFD